MKPETMTIEQLSYTLADCREALQAMPDNPKAGVYMDTIHACRSELNKRKSEKPIEVTIDLTMQRALINMVHGFADTAQKQALEGFWWILAEKIGLTDTYGNVNNQFTSNKSIKLKGSI